MNNESIRLLLRKLNTLDEKMDVMLRRMNRLCNRSQTQSAAADDDDAPGLPPGVCLPTDSVRGLAELDTKVTRDQDLRKKLVSIKV